MPCMQRVTSFLHRIARLFVVLHKNNKKDRWKS